jgi:ribose/xylose/arabinose/galactoside ABC-type transport system permease subunit
MVYFAASSACSLVNVIYRCRMSSALSSASSSAMFSSIAAVCIVSISFPLFPAGSLESRAAIR